MQPKGPGEHYSLSSLLYLSSSRLVSDAANAVHVMKMAAAFARIGIDTTLVAMRGHGSNDDVPKYFGCDPAAFSILRVPSAKPSVMTGLDALARRWPRARLGASAALALGSTQLRQLTLRTQPSVVYARNLWWALTAVPRDIRFAIEIHTLPLNSAEAAPHRLVLRRKNLSGVVFISEALRERYLALFPQLDWARTLVAHDGADPISPTERNHSWDRKPRIGYFGHLYPGRGIEIIVHLARGIPAAEVHVVGGTTADLAAWRERDLPTNLVFHGHVPHAQVPVLQAECDILVAPYQHRVSVSGGSGNTADYMSPLKIFEYMASAKAIIASDLPALKEVLQDGRNALLVAPDNAHQWVAAAKRLIGDPELQARIARAARDELELRYSWTARARRIAQFLSQRTAASI